MTKALFLDFDGVLFDSLPEAYRLGRFAYRGTDVHAPVDEADYARFSSLRFFVTHSAQYWRIFRLIDLIGLSGDDADYRNAYTQLVEEGHADEMRLFDENFLGLRKTLIAEEHAFWLSLSKPYPFFYEVKSLFRSASSPIIVTTKNRAAVLENLMQEGIFASPERIMDKADCLRAGGKRSLIASFMAREGIARGIFIDDILENIRECEGLPGLECLHAGWGYSAPSQSGLSPEEILTYIRQ